MTPKHKRLVAICISLLFIATGLGIILSNFRDNIVFFYSPTELHHNHPTKIIRVGGLVKKGSITTNATIHRFVLTDLEHEIKVEYHGLLPSLFREGQGMVARGKLGHDGVFIADELLTKHDENYMPKEVVDSLKKSGRWKE
jgi:cytochrome c-type biogenesis protein CcmE